MARRSTSKTCPWAASFVPRADCCSPSTAKSSRFATATTGRTAQNGTNGTNGTNGFQPALSLICNGAADLVNGAGRRELTDRSSAPTASRRRYFQYSVVVYSNGDVQTACGVTFGTVGDSSGGAYYPGATMGADNRYCQVIIDYPPAGVEWRRLAFTVNAQNVPSFTYVDSDTNHPLNNRVVSYRRRGVQRAQVERQRLGRRHVRGSVEPRSAFVRGPLPATRWSSCSPKYHAR